MVLGAELSMLWIPDILYTHAAAFEPSIIAFKLFIKYHFMSTDLLKECIYVHNLYAVL